MSSVRFLHTIIILTKYTSIVPCKRALERYLLCVVVFVVICELILKLINVIFLAGGGGSFFMMVLVFRLNQVPCRCLLQYLTLEYTRVLAESSALVL